MKNDLHYWLDKKSGEKVTVRIAVGEKTYGGKTTRDGKPVMPEGMAAMPAPAEESLAAAPVAAGRGWAGRPKFSLLFSGMAIVGGAVMVGLLMGWTVWTLLMPLPTG